MPLYNKIKTHCTENGYLNENVNWNVTRNVFQCRANMGQFSCNNITIKLGILEKFYDNEKESICKLCTMGVEEDLYHFLFECPKYNDKRKQLRNYLLPKCNSDYLTYFKEMDCKKMMETYIFMKNIIKIRGLN
jgi:hypothetical protein